MSNIALITGNAVFRELLQNADDEEARPVKIWFEKGEYLSREKVKVKVTTSTVRPVKRTRAGCSLIALPDPKLPY